MNRLPYNQYRGGAKTLEKRPEPDQEPDWTKVYPVGSEVEVFWCWQWERGIVLAHGTEARVGQSAMPVAVVQINGRIIVSPFYMDADIKALRAMQGEAELVYAFRRKGLDDFCTCDERRYRELKNKPNLFEVAVFYTRPQPAVPEKESILSDQLRRIRKLLLTLPEDCLGTGVANDCPPWSIRDEVIDGISKALTAAQKEWE
jgi:hypothetical protein